MSGVARLLLVVLSSGDLGASRDARISRGAEAVTGLGILEIAMGGDTITGVDIPPAPEHAGRPARERMLALAPWLMGIGVAVIGRLSATSRLRRRALIEAFSRGFAAINRGDPWFIPIAYEPDCEIYAAAGFRTLGLADCYHGHAGWRELIDAVEEPFLELRYTPEHLIDLGDRWVLRVGMSGTGHASGASTRMAWGSVYHVSSRGRIARQDLYLTWEETLAAAGLYGGR
jgi:hypothetical protein